MIKKSYAIDCLTKVEGHARLNVEMDGGSVRKAEMEVFEPSRYFEHMVVGKDYDSVPSISQRICGICSVIHTVTSIKAIEDAMRIVPSEQTEDLRRLLLCSSTIHSHTAHLFFFAAPDYAGVDDVVAMSRKHPEHMKLAIAIQQLSSGIVKAIGGRSLHPVTPRIGGFTSVPGKGRIDAMIRDFSTLKHLTEKAARLFMSFRYPDFVNETQHVSLSDKGEYALYGGDVKSLVGGHFSPRDYGKHIEEETMSRSTAKYAKFGGKPYMTGALPRINNNHRQLSGTARSLLRESGLRPPCFSTFMNNVAQAVEMVHCADAALEIIGKYSGKGMREERIDVKPRKGEGVAACEAPRGTLYHHYRFDPKGKATFANIITPTCQNVRNMEHDMQALMPGIIKQPEAKIKRTLEMLIRAYDPCFSCSTHFLQLSLRR